MDEERPFLPWIIFLSALALVAVVVVWLVSSTPVNRTAGAVQHPLAGKWHNSQYGTLIIYKDRFALGNGLKCSWEPTEGSAIRIELVTKEGSMDILPVTVMADFRLRPYGGGKQAVLNFLGQDLVFDRIEDPALREESNAPM